MVSHNRLNDGGSGPGKDWNMDNVHDFKKWIDDNRHKTDEGLDAMKAVMSIGAEVASAAAVNWFRERGQERDWVADRTEVICDAIDAGCRDGMETVIRDCASLFAGTGNVMMVMMMAFVSYSVIGVSAAEKMMASSDE